MPKGVYPRKPPLERFMAMTAVGRNPHNPWSPCLLWTGRKNRAGYGEFQVGGKKVLAHRWIYQHLIRSLPSSKQIDHFKCWNPSCVNVHHLRPATPLQNIRNGKLTNAVKTHCKHGHAFTPENTRRYIGSDGQKRRACRECERIRCHNYYHRTRKRKRQHR